MLAAEPVVPVGVAGGCRTVSHKARGTPYPGRHSHDARLVLREQVHVAPRALAHGQMMHFRGSHMVPNLDINNAMQYLTAWPVAGHVRPRVGAGNGLLRDG